MSEAARAVTQWALGRPEIFRVWATCDVENAASARLLERVGMQREGTLALRVPMDIRMAIGFGGEKERLAIEQVYRVDGYSVYYRQGNEFADARSVATVGFVAGLVFLSMGALLLASCDHPISSPADGSLTFHVVSGDQQTGAAGTQLPAALVVKVTKPDGGPLKDQILNFRVIAGGGSVFGGTEITNNDGVARELWTLGTKAGEPQRIEVRAVNSATGEPQVFAVFTATAVAGPPVRMSKVAGDGQEVEPGETVPVPPSVKLEDQFGNPTANIGVEFTVTRGSVTGGNATTDANGVATVGSWTVGSLVTTDTLVTRANASGISGNPARFFARVRFCDCWSPKATLLEAVTSARVRCGCGFSRGHCIRCSRCPCPRVFDAGHRSCHQGEGRMRCGYRTS